jgi:cellulose synthase (UDP-forming)
MKRATMLSQHPGITRARRLKLRKSTVQHPSVEARNQTAAHGVIERNLESPSLTMLVLLATLGVLLYAAFLLNPANAGDPLPYFMVVLCESFVMFQVLLSLWTALSAAQDPRGYAFHEAKRQLFYPTSLDLDDDLNGSTDWMQIAGQRAAVDVLVPTYGEAPHVVERTARAARDMHGHHRTYILDDGGSAEIADVAARLGVGYLRREDSAGAKAGNINSALKVTAGDYFVIFDADFVPSAGFLTETMPFFAEEAVAFVQTPQVYGNIGNFISRGAGYMQTVFYSLTQPGKNRFNSAFCVGTNVVFRKAAVQSIGGLYAKSKSEDIWTSIILHGHGWKSVYIPTILAVGDTPETIESYTKQQQRWATGAFEILFRRNPLLDRSLSVDQRLQYFGTATFYFSGLVTFCLLMLPPLQIYLNLTPVNQHTPFLHWVLFYCGLYVMQVIMAVYTIGSFRWQTLLLSTASFPIYTRAFINALRRKETAWHVTGRTGRANSPFHFILPQILTFAFLAATSCVGLWNVGWTGEISVAVIWNLLNVLVLGTFLGIAVHESVTLRRAEAASVPARRPARATLLKRRPA